MISSPGSPASLSPRSHNADPLPPFVPLKTVEVIKQCVIHFFNWVSSHLWSSRDAVLRKALTHGHVYTVERWLFHPTENPEHTGLIRQLVLERVSMQQWCQRLYQKNGSYDPLILLLNQEEIQDLQSTTSLLFEDLANRRGNDRDFVARLREKGANMEPFTLAQHRVAASTEDHSQSSSVDLDYCADLSGDDSGRCSVASAPIAYSYNLPHPPRALVETEMLYHARAGESLKNFRETISDLPPRTQAHLFLKALLPANPCALDELTLWGIHLFNEALMPHLKLLNPCSDDTETLQRHKNIALTRAHEAFTRAVQSAIDSGDSLLPFHKGIMTLSDYEQARRLLEALLADKPGPRKELISWGIGIRHGYFSTDMQCLLERRDDVPAEIQENVNIARQRANTTFQELWQHLLQETESDHSLAAYRYGILACRSAKQNSPACEKAERENKTANAILWLALQRGKLVPLQELVSWGIGIENGTFNQHIQQKIDRCDPSIREAVQRRAQQALDTFVATVDRAISNEPPLELGHLLEGIRASSLTQTDLWLRMALDHQNAYALARLISLGIGVVDQGKKLAPCVTKALQAIQGPDDRKEALEICETARKRFVRSF